MSSKNEKDSFLSGIRLVSYGGKYADSSKQKKGKASRKKKTPKLINLVIVLVPIVAVLLLALLIPSFLDHSGRYTLPETGYQYYGGSKAQVSMGSYLKQDSDGNTHIVNSNANTDISTNLPIYFEGLDAIVIPNEMVYYAPRKSICAKTELFSEVHCSGSNVRIQTGEKETPVDRGFLYDGKDFYLFLEPVVVKFNGYSLELPALSYVEARFNGDVMVFNYETKKFLIESPKTAVTAGVPSGDYEVSLLNDSMTLHDGTRTLLFTRADLLESVHGQK